MTFVPAMSQIMFVENETGYFIDGDSVYYDSTHIPFPSGMTPGQMRMLLGKKTLRKIKKIEKSKKKMEITEQQAKAKRLQESTLVPFADAKTFKSLRLYGVDRTHVFYRGTIIEDADPVTFTKVEEPEGYMQVYYYKDKNYVYYMGEILEGADVETFRYHTVTYAVDKNNVYLGGLALDIDPDNYTLMGGAYIIGSGKVFYGYKAVNVNSDSFELLEDDYATDGQKIIYCGEPVDADATTFRKLLSYDSVGYCHYGDCFYTDKHRLYYRGKPVEGTNSDSRILGERHLVNNGKVFYRTGVIPNADAGSFSSLNSYWGKDKQMVYHETKQLDSADPATFIAIGDWLGFDKNHFYKDDKILMNIDGGSLRHCEDDIYVDNNYVYVISNTRTYKKRVDGKTFEAAGRDGNRMMYKDKNRLYKYFDGKFKKARRLNNRK